MEMTFKNAFILSVLIHSAIISPSYRVSLPKPQIDDKKPIVVDYVILKEPDKVELVKKDTEIKTTETPRVELKKTIDLKPASPKDEARIRSTDDYINYYQLIREKIRKNLKANYKDYSNEGDVSLVFTLNSGGRLESLDIERQSSTTDAALLDIAVRSVKEASPFPSFPKALTLPKMSFNLIVSFRRR